MPLPSKPQKAQMEKITKEGLEIFQFSNLSKFKEINHFVTGRAGGFSKGHFKSLNTGFHVGDNDWTVFQNRKKLAHVLNVNVEHFTFGNQTHSSNIAIIDCTKRGKGSTDFESSISNTDGLVSKTPKIYLCVQMADCVPILMYDPVMHVIAAVHAGWKGTLRKIAEVAVKTMMHTFGSTPVNIIAGLGPSNGPCCYEVGEDVKTEAERSLGNTSGIIKDHDKPGKYIFDQWNANFLQLTECGIPEKNIEISGFCSQCNSDTFFSSRKDNGLTGRISAGIMLK
jgi:polyphenol oxidase